MPPRSSCPRSLRSRTRSPRIGTRTARPKRRFFSAIFINHYNSERVFGRRMARTGAKTKPAGKLCRKQKQRPCRVSKFFPAVCQQKRISIFSYRILTCFFVFLTFHRRQSARRPSADCGQTPGIQTAAANTDLPREEQAGTPKSFSFYAPESGEAAGACDCTKALGVRPSSLRLRRRNDAILRELLKSDCVFPRSVVF